MSLFCLNLKVKFLKESSLLSLIPNSSAGHTYNSKVSVFDEQNQLTHKLDLQERMGLVISYSHTLGLNFLLYPKHLFSDKQPDFTHTLQVYG